MNSDIHDLKKATTITDQSAHSDCHLFVCNHYGIDRPSQPDPRCIFGKRTQAGERAKTHIFFDRWKSGYGAIFRVLHIDMPLSS